METPDLLDGGAGPAMYERKEPEAGPAAAAGAVQMAAVKTPLSKTLMNVGLV